MPIHRAADCTRRIPDAGITILDHGVSTEAMTVVRAELHGFHLAPANRRSTMTYVVTGGHVSFSIDGETFSAGPGDIVVAPAGGHRTLEGSATLVIISTPGFDPADEAG